MSDNPNQKAIKVLITYMVGWGVLYGIAVLLAVWKIIDIILWII